MASRESATPAIVPRPPFRAKSLRPRNRRYNHCSSPSVSSVLLSWLTYYQKHIYPPIMSGRGAGSARKRRRGDDSGAEDAPASNSSEGGGGGGGAGAGAGRGRSGARERRAARRRASRAAAPSDDEGAVDGDGEDLLEGDIRADYRPMAALDEYDERDLDRRGYGGMDAEARREAEAEMRARDRLEGRGRATRLPAALAGESEGEEGDLADADELRERRARRRRIEDGAAGGFDEDEEEEEPFNLENFDVPLREWIALEGPRNEVKRRFKHFLRSYMDRSGDTVYDSRITRMCSNNEQSLEVSYLHLSHMTPVLAIWLADEPKEMLEIFNEVTQNVVVTMFPDYSSIHDEIFVRIADLPVSDSLRDLREVHLNALIRVSGVVTRRTGVFPQLKVVRFTCTHCGNVSGPIQQTSSAEVKIASCPDCQASGPFTLNSEQSVYRNFQKITLQESPGSVPAGRVPRYKDVILLADLIDRARPGEEIEVTGVFTNQFDAALNTRQGFPVFSTVIEANHVQKKDAGTGGLALTEEDRAEIHALAKDPRIGERIIRSIAPSIYGHEHVKTAVALSLFGGSEKDVNQKHRIRGDINVLLLGDPGTAKSQMLKYVETTAPRAVFTTGKGASAVGLTAAVQKDPVTGEFTLEGGALVLADQGVCLIDEFDKMNDQDRTSIHEAMEQQSISISKAGIVASLRARCAVLAAANPIGGRYDPQKTFAENVLLTDPILQRFDCLCVLQDTVDPVHDERLARFVVGSHVRSHPSVVHDEPGSEGAGATDSTSFGHTSGGAGGPAADESSDAARSSTGSNKPTRTSGSGSRPASPAMGAPEDDKDIIPQDLLRKYIAYARSREAPKLLNLDQDKMTDLYADLRRESEISGGVPIAVRHIESILRMSEAHARMHLRMHVVDADVDKAIATMLESFVQAQKFSVTQSLRRHFNKYLTHTSDHNTLLLHLLTELVKEQTAMARMKSADGLPLGEVRVEASELVARARERGIADVSAFYKSELFKRHGFTAAKRRGRVTEIKKVF